ncbi:hypothetical protein COCON_G00141840 [Conger conger]|uniref:Uncharacterized protein n=1 Tax=Conger conger TaxID=82655 RepID=A0A9Q1HVP0_CONCO|nr:hypothetical protein COCON_G00141840 [Conger conger]
MSAVITLHPGALAGYISGREPRKNIRGQICAESKPEESWLRTTGRAQWLWDIIVKITRAYGISRLRGD